MRKEQIFLMLSIALILILLIIVELQKPLASGEVSKISGSNPVKISLENQGDEIILFTKKLNITVGAQIRVYGSRQNKQEIIANKITCSNC